MTTETKMLRLPAVLERTGLSRASIYRLMNQGQFPAAVTLGPNSVGWPEDWINSWIESRIAVGWERSSLQAGTARAARAAKRAAQEGT